MTTNAPELPTIPIDVNAIRLAAERLAPWVHRTPVMTSKTLDRAGKCSVFLKCENLQKVGAFKFRGAMNAILQLKGAERDGVITHSSGNHGQAVALAGRLLGVPVTGGDAANRTGREAARPQRVMVPGSCSASQPSPRARKRSPPRSSVMGSPLCIHTTTGT